MKVINYAAGADMSLMRDGSYIVMRDGEFYWSVYSNNDGFSLCPQGSNYNWIYWSRYLRTYGSSSGNSDVRCKLRVTKADVNEFPENIMVKNEKTLNYAGKDVPEDYRPNITLAPTDMWIGDTGEPSTLGALTFSHHGCVVRYVDFFIVLPLITIVIGLSRIEVHRDLLED